MWRAVKEENNDSGSVNRRVLKVTYSQLREALASVTVSPCRNMTTGQDAVNEEVDPAPSALDARLSRFGLPGRLLYLFLSHQRWWMWPIVLLLGLLLLALVGIQAASFVAPFIYTVF